MRRASARQKLDFPSSSFRKAIPQMLQTFFLQCQTEGSGFTWLGSSGLTHLAVLQTSKHDREKNESGPKKISERHKAQRVRKARMAQGEENRWGGMLYLGNLIISHLQSTSVDAPSLHHAAHCEDKASSAGQPVDFPLSLSQRGPACPYITRSGHANSDGNPSAATQTTQL